MPVEAKPRIAEKLSTLAAEIAVSVDRIVKWIREGKLPAFLEPGKEIGSSDKGAKLYRVFRDDWERFLLANTRIGGTAPAADAEVVAAKPIAGLATGTDGVRRRRRGKVSS